MNKTIFMCVDAQNDFFKNGSLEVPNVESIRPNIKKLIEFARERKVTIVYTQDEHSIDDKEFKIFPSHCVTKTIGQYNIHEAKINDNEKVFTKQTYDVFTNLEIKDWLKDNQVKSCYMFGLVGNICVEAAAMGLRKLGINVYIFDEAVVWMDLDKGIFCNDNDNKEKSKKRLKEFGCHFVKCNL